MRWSDPREAVDVGIGFVGFFAVAFFVITLVCELTGQPALVWALITLVLVLLFVALWQARRRIIAARLRAREEQAASENL
ncbi:hypothetical protein LLS1_24820 [Leifsonia sp. LS1]|uniref:hypothetical protein n=1 Tax=unclassified Leifsonia TaxID=2663824 RepID=UPI001CC0B270|nr:MULTISPECIES: hypothetical protein [unclassified Leifsonia]UAJ80333.1 hypothetical protein IT072_04635 [Leifsonia sp. ZF2019]GIT80813.1 hypothetical protein LLS1_24820 [Leifsonia sp. LS1]